MTTYVEESAEQLRAGRNRTFNRMPGTLPSEVAHRYGPVQAHFRRRGGVRKAGRGPAYSVSLASVRAGGEPPGSRARVQLALPPGSRQSTINPNAFAVENAHVFGTGPVSL